MLCRMSEPPFRPREKLIEKQKHFQSIHKHTYLKGPYDKITSVAIPIALAASALYLIVSWFIIWSVHMICIHFVRLKFSVSLLSFLDIYLFNIVWCLLFRDEGSIICHTEQGRKNDLASLLIEEVAVLWHKPHRTSSVCSTDFLCLCVWYLINLRYRQRKFRTLNENNNWFVWCKRLVT